MFIKAVRSDKDLAAALARLDELWGAAVDTPEGHELEHLMDMVERYEDEHHPVPAPSPAATAEFLADQHGNLHH
ncbi:transcriptional regulator [Pseudomonas sp. BNK-15]|uniref:transcriptional regulator n=1 Tax=Pseudomonas sp. BNK-15 TaxID=3376152 RepID=UPI0039BF4912